MAKKDTLPMNIDVNDLNTKVNQARKFLSKGDKVKVSLRFRGRELAHVNASKIILDEFAEKPFRGLLFACILLTEIFRFGTINQTKKEKTHEKDPRSVPRAGHVARYEQRHG